MFSKKNTIGPNINCSSQNLRSRAPSNITIDRFITPGNLRSRSRNVSHQSLPSSACSSSPSSGASEHCSYSTDFAIPPGSDQFTVSFGSSEEKQQKRNMQRSESIAYAHIQSPSNKMAQIIYYIRRHSSALTASICFIVFLLVLSDDGNVQGNSSYSGLRSRGSSRASAYWGGAASPGYFKAQDAILDAATFKFAAVTDLDQLSRLPGDKQMFQSFLLSGTLSYNPSANSYAISFDRMRNLVSGHNEAGRGMELSELTLYNDRLLAFDDRTGSVFEILSSSPSESYVVPRFVITEGEGDTDKGMKWEWATTKGSELYLGSMGKEYTKPDGTVVNTNNLWIAIINGKGDIRRQDWSSNYNFVRNLLGAQDPGYVIHEAVLWSEQLKKWVFIPRRVSNQRYDDVADEKMGTNKVVLVNENFTSGKVLDINMKTVDPLHGFSTAAFVPNSGDKHVLAMRSVEEDCVGGDENLCKQRSYIMVFDCTTGEVLMDEVKIEEDIKFEGVEFVDISTYPHP